MTRSIRGAKSMAVKTKLSVAQPGPDDHVLTLCHMLANRISKAFSAELEAHDVNVAEWRVLLTLAMHGTASGQEITGRWAMDKMAINRAITGLDKRGLIEKRKNSQDRRITDLFLTSPGKTFYEKFVPMANQRYRDLMAGLDKEEEKNLRQVLIKMILHADGMVE